MLDRLRDTLVNYITSRVTVLTIVVLVLTGILINRVFELQIVNGENYMNEFSLMIKKERSIPSSRGNIYDRNGKLLAYNELAYSVTIEDVYESKNKNANLNATLEKTIQILESNGDDVVSDFSIYLDKDGAYAFNISGTRLLRFLADIYGHTYTDDLKEKEKNSTAQDVIDYMAANYGIGQRLDPEDKDTFVPGLGYSRDMTLKLVIVRYAMRANSYQKYIPVTIATDVSESTVAAIKENNADLLGVDIAEDTIRRYVNGTYFSHIIGYTGKASTEDLEEFNTELAEEGKAERYAMNDTVGKAGIERVMETRLQGEKGSEIIYVDNMGKEIESEGRVDPIAGNDVYLSIDADLQEAVYNILEQSIAGILLDKIINVKEYEITEDMSAANRKIAIDDVYFALFNNNVIDMEHMASVEAGPYEQQVQSAFLTKKEQVNSWLEQELNSGRTPYRELPKEYQIYESYIVTDLLINQSRILSVDTEDAVYQTWTRDETISLSEFLEYAIAQNWIDVSRLEMEGSYADSAAVFDSLVREIWERLNEDHSFLKKMFKYMLRDNKINGKQVCMILEEQNCISVSSEEIENLESGATTPYYFMTGLIEKLEITPAQLALDPYSGSSVVVDSNTGELLALVSYPSYDNNRLANGIDAEYYAALQSDLSKPLWDYATQMRSAPGSTFKMVSASSILMSQTADLSTEVFCTGSFTRFERPFRCWVHPGRHGDMNIATSITNSCNCFYYEMAYQMGVTGGGEDAVYDNELANAKMLEYVDQYGLSEKSGIEIEESAPLVSRDANASQAAIGQGTHSYTTVGLARYVTTVASSGNCYNLTLLDRVTDRNGNLLEDYHPEIRSKVELPTSYWDAIHAGMKGVVDKKAYFGEAGIIAAGKTGTAEENKLRPNHALFVGYAPYEDPAVAIATRIANGYTSDYAAQISCKVLQYYFNPENSDDILSGTAERPDAVTSSGD